jgi:hypothetical protein
MPSIDTIFEPLVKHRIAPPAIIQLTIQLRSQGVQHSMSMAVGTMHGFSKSGIVIDAHRQIRRGRHAYVIE